MTSSRVPFLELIEPSVVRLQGLCSRYGSPCPSVTAKMPSSIAFVPTRHQKEGGTHILTPWATKHRLAGSRAPRTWPRASTPRDTEASREKKRPPVEVAPEGGSRI